MSASRKQKTTDPATVTAALASVSALVSAGIETITEARLFLAVLNDNLAGTRNHIVHYSETLGIPMSTLSRVSYDLVGRGLLNYEPHATDRRKKLMVADATRM